MKIRHNLLVLLVPALLLSACSAAAPAAQPAEESTAQPAEEILQEEVVPVEAENEAAPVDDGPITVTDMIGREVTLAGTAQRVVAIGPGALRLYIYAASPDKIVGVEQIEIESQLGRAYMLANPALTELPVIGQGGPNNAPDPEKLLVVAPDVIISTYAADAASADELQAKTGIPVVVLSYGDSSIFDDPVYDSLTLVGKIMGDSTKADQSIAFIQQAAADLNGRTADIPDEEKPTVYVGGLGSRGAHGIESTRANYALLNIINAANVVDETGESGSIMIDKEKLLEWDPDYIFVDQGGFSYVVEDYQKNPTFYQSLSAMQNGSLYSQLPYNYYSTNIDTAIADAYYLGKVLYPDAFADVDPAAMADEIYLALVGQALYKQMAADFGGFGQVILDQE